MVMNLLTLPILLNKHDMFDTVTLLGYIINITHLQAFSGIS